MTEQIIAAFLERGVLGLVCLLALLALWKRDRQMWDLYRRYTEQLIADATRNAQLATEVTGAITDLNESCEDCPYKKFTEGLGDGGG